MPGGRSYNWVFTLNNYTEEDIKNVDTWIQKGAGGVAYGKEVGANGTPHLQGYVHMEKQSNLKKMKELTGKAHWEIMKGKLRDSKKYCSKQSELTIIGKNNYTEDRFAQTRLAALAVVSLHIRPFGGLGSEVTVCHLWCL